jgi:hypothetical protein
MSAKQALLGLLLHRSAHSYELASEPVSGQQTTTDPQERAWAHLNSSA